MARTCKNCYSSISDEHKFCTKCGTKIEEKVEEEIIVNDSQSNQNKKENIPNYNKIGGFLIFIGIILVLGLLGTVTFFNENYTNEYYESLATLYVSNNELFTLLNISYYLALICLFFLILLNISFFTKSNITKKLAIIYFTLLIITDIYGVFIFSDNEEIMSKLSIEIIKISFQIVSASLFIIYFSISKRVKETFIEEKNFKLHIVIASIVPIILFLYYSDKLNEIKNVSLEEEIIKNKSNVQSNNYSSDTSSSVENKESLDNNNISKIDTNEEIKKEKNTTKNQSHKWKYKDWEIENIDDNFIKAFTIGKNRADVFTIIKKKEDCKPSFLYTTTHLFDKSIQVNKNDILKMDIKVDNELFNSDTAIYEIFDLRFVKQLMSSPYPLYESFIEKLKNGNTIQTTVFSPILKDIDITPNEEYSLNGFTKTYNVLNEACRDINALNRYKEVDKNLPSDEYYNNMGTNNTLITKFIENYLSKIGSGFYFNRLFSIENMYSNQVKYYTWGEVLNEKIKEDKINYLNTWPFIKYELLGINNIFSSDDNKVKVIFDVGFKVWSFEKAGIQGKAKYILEIDLASNKIIAEESNIYKKYEFKPNYPSQNNLPFIGEKRFNFFGRYDSWNLITFHNNGKYEFSDFGEQNVENLEKKGVIFIENQICDKSINLCTYLED